MTQLCSGARKSPQGGLLAMLVLSLLSLAMVSAQDRPAECSDILTTQSMFARPAMGVDLTDYVGQPFWIGCLGAGCEASSFYCTESSTSLEFGTTSTRPMRSCVEVDQLSSCTWNGCCRIEGSDLCDSPDKPQDAQAICEALGYAYGTVIAVSGNICPEAHWDAGSGRWTSDYWSSDGYGRVFTCNGPLTVTTTTTTTATTATVTCGAGFAPDGGACSPCDPGTHADMGAQACLPILAHTLSTIQTPELSMANDGWGVVRMAVAVSELPTTLYQGGTLHYAVDMTASEEWSGLSLEKVGECGALWTTSAPELAAVLLYDDLAGPCNMNVDVNDSSIVLQGFLNILLLRTLSNETSLVAHWHKPIEITFDRSVLAGNDPFHVSGTTLAGGQRMMYVSQFGSVLVEYASPAFEVALNPLATVYVEGDLVFLAHSLQPEVDGLSLVPEMAWYSKSSNPAERAAMILDIADLGQSTGAARFSVRATECRQCFLHVASKIVDDNVGGRRMVQRSADDVEGRKLVQSAHTLVHLFMDVRGAEGAGPPLVTQPWLAIGVSAAMAISLGACIQCIQAWCCAGDCDPIKFLFFELMDVLLDVILYILNFGAGDLRFANDEGGLTNKAILASTVLSGILFVCELWFWRTRQRLFGKWVPVLIGIHAATEDLFQLSLYGFVQVSHTEEDLLAPAVVAAIIAGVVFVIQKIWDVFRKAQPQVP